MKLRQKLAAVMAATMVVTAVPVMTSAASTNSMSLSSVSIVKDGTIGFTAPVTTTTSSTYNVTSAPLTLNIRPASNQSTINQTFFVDVENAEFSKEAYYAFVEGREVTVDNKGNEVVSSRAAANTLSQPVYTTTVGTSPTTAQITVKPISSTQLEVNVNGSLTKDDVIQVPIFAVAKSGEVKLSVDGSETFVSTGEITIGTTSSKALVATADEVKTISIEGGKIGNILIKESAKGALAAANDKVIKIELPSSSDLEFGSKKDIKLVGKRGFAGVDFTALDLENDVKVEGQTLTIDLTNVIPASQTTLGHISIEGIEVKPENKTAAKGDIVVSVKNKDMDTAKITVGKVVDEDTTLTCEEVVELVSGKESKDVTFKLEELTQDSITAGRKVDFTIENGFIAVRKQAANSTSYMTALETLQELITAGDIELPEEVKSADIVDAEADAEGRITGFTVEFNHLDEKSTSELEFTMPIMTAIDATGEVKLVVEGRAIQGKKELVIAKTTAPFSIEAEAVEVKVGLNGQAGGKLTIKETAAEMFDKGIVEIAMEEYTGITFKKDQELSVEAKNLKIRDVKVTKEAITFEVERTSDEAGSIEIKNIEFNVDRTAPEGAFDVTISGEAISTNKYIKEGVEKLTVADFVKVATKNTQDITTGANGLKNGTAAFTIDSKTYIVNGQEKTMDGMPYLANGRTMVPVRYVSEAFGIAGENVLFNKGVVTLFAGNRIVQLTNGSNVAVVNGVSVTMTESVTIKEGRTYIPVGEVGRILGIKVEWNNETKTATFSN